MHSLRRTKAAKTHRKTVDLRAGSTLARPSHTASLTNFTNREADAARALSCLCKWIDNWFEAAKIVFVNTIGLSEVLLGQLYQLNPIEDPFSFTLEHCTGFQTCWPIKNAAPTHPSIQSIFQR